MLNLKKTIASLCTTLLLLQGVSAISLNQDRAEAATWKPAIQDLMSREYPIVMGNQFGSTRFDSTMNNWVAKNLDIVVINKSGDLFADNGPNSDIASKIHAINPNVKVLQYVNIMDVWQSQATYTWMKNNNAFLYDDAGKVVHPYQSSYGTNRWAGDSTKTNWQTYYAAHVKKQTDGGMDGVFSDNWFRTNSQGWNINSTRFGNLIKGWETMGQKSKSAMGSSKILVGNSPAWSTYQSRDITMIESRNAPNSSAFNTFLKDSDTAAGYGQATFDTIYWAWDGSTGYMSTYASILDFSLPACLLTDDIFGIPNNSTIFGIMEKVGKIGYPKGARYRASGILQRDFTAGKVLFNDTSKSVTVTLPTGTYKDVNGTAKNSVTLASYRGIVLKGANSSSGGSSGDSSNGSTTTTAPTAPSNLAVASVSKASTSGAYYVNLTWKDNSSNETGFEILQSTDGQNYQTVKTPAANATGYGVNVGTSTGTYYFQVRALNSAGKSAVSNTTNTTIGSSGSGSSDSTTATTPTAPSNLTVASVSKASTSGAYYVNLTWKDNSSNETGFEILQSTDGQNYQTVKTPAANATGYGVNVGTSTGTYYFQVRALNSAGKSAVSNTANTTIGSSSSGSSDSTTAATPTAPSNLTVASVSKASTSGAYYVNLTWKDNSSNETGFEILQSTDGQNYQTVKTPAVNATGYGVNVGTLTGTYYFQVRALNSTGKSAVSNTTNTTIGSSGSSDSTGGSSSDSSTSNGGTATGAPTAPTNLTSSVTKTPSYSFTVNLSWKDNSSNETGFQVLKSSSASGPFTVIATTTANTTSYGADIGTKAGTYYFQVKAVNASGTSASSNTVSGTASNSGLVPQPPAIKIYSVTKGASTGTYYVNIAWSQYGYNIDGYELLQSINSTSNFQVVKKIATGKYTDAVNIGTSPKGTYYFQLRAYNENGSSTPSNTVSKTFS